MLIGAFAEGGVVGWHGVRGPRENTRADHQNPRRVKCVCRRTFYVLRLENILSTALNVGGGRKERRGGTRVWWCVVVVVCLVAAPAEWGRSRGDSFRRGDSFVAASGGVVFLLLLCRRSCWPFRNLCRTKRGRGGREESWRKGVQ